MAEQSYREFRLQIGPVNKVGARYPDGSRLVRHQEACKLDVRNELAFHLIQHGVGMHELMVHLWHDP